MFEQMRRLVADQTTTRHRLHTLAARAGRVRPDDELPDDQEWVEDSTPPGAGRLVEHFGAGGRIGRPRWLVVAITVVLLLALGIGIAVASGGGPVPEPVAALPSAVEPSKASPSPQPAAGRIVVSVRGRVRHPGLVGLPTGARVADAIKACGGLRPGADSGPLNLARKLGDGEQIYVAIPAPTGTDQSATGPSTSDSGGTVAGAKIDLNTATAQQLDTLPGVGAVTAQRILQWRTQHGRFASVDQLRDVDGIGDARFATLRGLVVVQ